MDADWARDDFHKSTSGILYKLGSSPIEWSSKLQSTIALSSTEVEYCILSKGAQNITYYWRLMKELQVK